jgi:ligand-binding sensor domain-containing protein
MLLVQLTASKAHAQGITATGPASGSDAHSWVHESWTVKDGLPVNSINAIIQDRTGYIWAATFDGLVRFDGLRFTVFNSANSEELPSNRIIQLKEGRDGSLWLATEQSHIARFRDGRFTNVAFETGKPGAGIPTLFVDAAGGVWVGTNDGLWTARRDRLVRVGRGMLDAPVTSIVQRRDGSVWVGTYGAGLFRVDGDSRVTKVVTDPALDADFISRMFEDASGALWIAGTQALWSLHERLVRVKPLLGVTNIVQVRAAAPVFVEAATGVYRIDSDSAVLVRPTSVSDGFRLWADAGAIWTVDGPHVLRDDRRVLTLPDRRFLSTAFLTAKGASGSARTPAGCIASSRRFSRPIAFLKAWGIRTSTRHTWTARQ